MTFKLYEVLHITCAKYEKMNRRPDKDFGV